MNKATTESATISLARLEDLPAIVEIYNSTIPSQIITSDDKPVTVEERLEWFNEHAPETYPLWVAKSNHKIAGWLSLSKFHPRPAYQITAEIGIYINEECRRQGIGGMLLDHAIQMAPELGFECLVALVFAQNKPSITILESKNFVVWANLPRVASFAGSYRDLVILGKHLKQTI